jgi:hypothetical protein
MNVMTGFSTLTKWCPVCGDAMARVASDGSATSMHRCNSCKTETSKPRDRKRSHASHIRRCGRVLRPSTAQRFFPDAG